MKKIKLYGLILMIMVQAMSFTVKVTKNILKPSTLKTYVVLACAVSKSHKASAQDLTPYWYSDQSAMYLLSGGTGPSNANMLMQFKLDSVKIMQPKIAYPNISTSAINGSSKMLSINAGNVQAATSFTNISISASQVSDLSSVATTGSYNDLTNKPSVPTYTNLNQFVNGPGYITSAPNASVVTTGIATSTTSGNSFTINVPAPTAQVPQTLVGVGSVTVTSGVNSFTINAPQSSSLSAGSGVSISGGTITNTAPESTTITAGNRMTVTKSGSSYTVAATKRQETYSGTTDASGNYTVTFSTAYSVAPNIQCQVIAGTTETFLRVTSITATGFTINVYTRGIVSSLPVIGVLTNTLLGATTTPLSAANVDVLITEK